MKVYAQDFPMEYLGDTVEALIIGHKAGLKIGQVPVGMRQRRGGVASHNPGRAAVFLVRALLAMSVAITRPATKAIESMTYLGVVIGVVALSVVVYLLAQLRARRIRERYVWLWLLLLAGLGTLAIFPALLTSLSTFFGFQVASNLVLTAAAIVTFLVTVSLSGAVSALHMSVRTLTEEIAFLRAEVDELHAKEQELDANQTCRSGRPSPSRATRPVARPQPGA